MPAPIARPSSTLSSPEDTPSAPQLPRFLWGPDPEDDDEEQVPGYSAVPIEDRTREPAASLTHTASKDTISSAASDTVSLFETDRASISTSATSLDESSGNENAERDSPVIGTSGNRIEDVTQTPVFAQLKTAQTGTPTTNASSVYTFGRRLATCKFFRPTKGYGFLNDVKPAELGFQDVMVHATELYGPRNARIQSLARGELVEYTLVWAQHRGFYAVSVTGPGAVPVIGDAACNNGSTAYGRVSGQSPATARPPMTLAAAANAPILNGDRRPQLLSALQGPPHYDTGDNAVQTSTPLSPLSPTFTGIRSPLPSPGASSTFSGSAKGSSPLPSPRVIGSGWPTSYTTHTSSNSSSAATTSPPQSNLVEQLMEQNQMLMRRLAVLENKSGGSPMPTPPGLSAPASIWAPLPSPRS